MTRALCLIQSPRTASLLLGPVAIVLGMLLLARPFTSISILVLVFAVTAVATEVERILASAEAPFRAVAIGVGVAWIALAGIIVFLPGLSVRGLALAVGVGLVISGLG